MHHRSLLLRYGAPGVLLALNLFGVLVYLWGARHAWIIPEEAANGIHSITGEPYVWAGFVLPVWGAFLIINLIWGFTIMMRKRWVQGRWWLTSGIIWIAAVIVDFAHH